MSNPSALAVACRLAPSIKSAMRLDLNDIDIDQRIVCKQKQSEFSPQALVGLNWIVKSRLWQFMVFLFSKGIEDYLQLFEGSNCFSVRCGKPACSIAGFT